MLCSLSSRPLFMFSVMASTVIAGATIASLGSDARASTAQASAAKGGDTASAAVSYDVDDVHSKALFRVHHLGAGQFWGVFEDVKGTATYEPGKKLSLDVSIDTKSVDSGNSDLDEHLRSPDFFDVKEFPAMTFKSKNGVLKSPGTWEVCGDLSMHGQTHEACATITMTGSADTAKGRKAGFEATFTIKRSQWGMTYGVEKNSLGDEVRVIVALEAGKAS